MSTARAGWAEIETTPPLGLPMGGRGPRFTPGREILDPLIAQAIVLEDSRGNRVLWISVDLVGLSPVIAEPLRYDLSALTGIPLEAVILNYSHTHSGPMGGFEGYATPLPKPRELHAYDESLCRNIVRVALAAVENLQPVTVTEFRGASAVGINRRRRGPSGEMGMGPNPDGAHNPDLWLIDVAALDGGDRCVVFSYGCHPVIVYGYAWDGISADFPGVCRAALRSELGANVHSQFIQGLAGNVRPRVLADLNRGRFRKSTPSDTVAAGTDLAGDIVRTLRGEGARLDLDIAAAQGRFLAPRDQSRIPPADHWRTLAGSDDELNRNLGGYWVERLESGIPPVKAVPWPVGLIRLAEGRRIAWIAGEVLAEWLGLVRDWLDDPDLIAWGYCQEGRGYLPTDELLPEGGYEVDRANTYTTTGPGPFAEGLNASARQTFLSLARQLEG
ncbi:MAG: hypothetical protein OXU79_08085 [Gemmatimonadota bacterium]|nr:hypothetical protein [Gemmatimonadota bacterium]